MPTYCTDTSRRTCPPKPQCRLSCNPIERHINPCKPPLSDPNKPPPYSAFPYLPFGTGTTPNTNNSAPISRSPSRYRPTLRAGCNRSLKTTCKSWPITDRGANHEKTAFRYSKPNRTHPYHAAKRQNTDSPRYAPNGDYAKDRQKPFTTATKAKPPHIPQRERWTTGTPP